MKRKTNKYGRQNEATRSAGSSRAKRRAQAKLARLVVAAIRRRDAGLPLTKRQHALIAEHTLSAEDRARVLEGENDAETEG